jgi:quinol monooxygenase YgiN
MNRRQAGTYAFAGAAAMAAYYGAPTVALAEDAALGPVLAVISHPVADLAAWRVVYDEAQPVRDAAGVTGAEVFVDAANPLMVVIIHLFASMDAAQGFFNNPDLAAAMQRGGVTAPPTIIFALAA